MDIVKMLKTKEEFETNGKNKVMLQQLKKDLKNYIHIYVVEKNKDKSVTNSIGKCFLKLSQLATIRYWYNFKGKNEKGIDFDMENVVGDITFELWSILYKKKFKYKKLKDNNSTYNFFMMSANNWAKYFIRRTYKHLHVGDNVTSIVTEQ